MNWKGFVRWNQDYTFFHSESSGFPNFFCDILGLNKAGFAQLIAKLFDSADFNTTKNGRKSKNSCIVLIRSSLKLVVGHKTLLSRLVKSPYLVYINL